MPYHIFNLQGSQKFLRRTLYVPFLLFKINLWKEILFAKPHNFALRIFFSPSIQFTTLIFSYNITSKYLLPMSSGKIYMKTEFSFFSTGSSIRYQRQTVICWQVRTIHSTNIEISRGTLNEKHLNFHGEIYNLIT